MVAAQTAALRALRDCGVIRARIYAGSVMSLVFSAYAELEAAGLATGRSFSQHEDDPHPRRDYRLTERGRAAAALLPVLGW